MRFLAIGLLFLSFALMAQEKPLELAQKRSLAIRQVFNDLRAHNTDILDNFYTDDVIFEDPIGQVSGRTSIKQYYQAMYKNVLDIRFEFKDDAIKGDRHLVVWTMYLRAKELANAEEISVHGVSEIEFQADSTLAIYHRDFFDMGEFLYQHVPLLGSVIKLVRRQLNFKPDSGQ